MTNRPNLSYSGFNFRTQLILNEIISVALTSKYSILPPFTLQVEMLNWIQKSTGCCCMTQSNFILPLISEEITTYSETHLNTLMSTLTSLILTQLSGKFL